MSFTFTPNSILPDVIIIEYDCFIDDRGVFSELYCKDEFCKYGMPRFVQENISRSKKNTVRGLHYQTNTAKLIRSVKGRLIDIVVDGRKEALTYGKYIKIELNENDNKLIYIPGDRFFHGFLALKDNTEINYKVSEYYKKEDEYVINILDSDLGIELPKNIIRSKKDTEASELCEIVEDFR